MMEGYFVFSLTLTHSRYIVLKIPTYNKTPPPPTRFSSSAASQPTRNTHEHEPTLVGGGGGREKRRDENFLLLFFQPQPPPTQQSRFSSSPICLRRWRLYRERYRILFSNRCKLISAAATGACDYSIHVLSPERHVVWSCKKEKFILSITCFRYIFFSLSLPFPSNFPRVELLDVWRPDCFAASPLVSVLHRVMTMR